MTIATGYGNNFSLMAGWIIFASVDFYGLMYVLSAEYLYGILFSTITRIDNLFSSGCLSGYYS